MCCVCVCQGLALDKEEHIYIHRLIYCESQKVGKVQLYHDSAAMKTAWNLLDSLQSDRRQEPQLVGCASTCSPASANWACLTSWQGTNSVWCLWQTFWDVESQESRTSAYSWRVAHCTRLQTNWHYRAMCIDDKALHMVSYLIATEHWSATRGYAKRRG